VVSGCRPFTSDANTNTATSANPNTHTATNTFTSVSGRFDSLLPNRF
jgi:hypothetical protein